MPAIAKKYRDQSKPIMDNIEKTYEYFKENYLRFNYFRKFAFVTSLTDDDIAALKDLDKPQVEFNVLESFISRLLGEFSKQEPSISVHAADGAKVNPQLIKVVEDHMRAILFNANNDGFEYEVYKDLLSGGFSVMKIWTEYASELRFEQNIRIGRVYDPTLCGFDPMARLPHKADGKFAFELFPMSADEAKDQFDNLKLDKMAFNRQIEGFNWSYSTGKEDIVMIGDYYEKKMRKAKLLQLSNGATMLEEEYEDFVTQWNNQLRIEQAPIIIRERKTEIPVICRYKIAQDQVLDYEETDFRYLPLIFVDGNSILMRENNNGAVKQVTRPYIYQARDVQRLKNFAGQTLANELENMVQHKLMAAKEGIPPEYTDGYTDYQHSTLLVYNAFYDENPEQAVPPPQAVPRVPIPPEITNTFTVTDQTIQMILGSFDASLGINDNQLSGVAIVEGATQSNAAAMPYIVGFLQGLNQAAQIMVDLMPKYYLLPRSIPVVMPNNKKSSMPINQPGGMPFNFSSNDLDVKVEAGVNFSVQKSKALQQIIALMQASPIFAQFMNQEGLEMLLDNVEIRGIEQLKDMSGQFMQQLKQQQQMQMQAQQQAMQNNPAAIKAKTDQQKVQLEQQRLMLDAQQNQTENQLKAAQLANDAQANDNEKLKLVLEAHLSHQDALVQADKAQAERYAKSVDLALATQDQQHRHSKELTELAHSAIELDHKMRTDNAKIKTNTHRE